MGNTRLQSLLALCFAGMMLGGCASTEPKDTGPGMELMEQAPAMENTTSMADEQMGPRVQNGKIVIRVDDGTGNMLATEMLNGIFYFDFDQAIVKRTGHSELDKHARVLAGDRLLHIRLEGHADEKGTREYNLALGERRADAVRAYLVAQGAAGSQIEVISYGEEKPASMGHSESDLAQNRRVEIVYR